MGRSAQFVERPIVFEVARKPFNYVLELDY